MYQIIVHTNYKFYSSRGRGTGGGALGAKAPPLFECEVNVPFSWIESALFHGIEVPFLHGIEVPFLHGIELIEARLPFFGNCRAKF